MFPVSEFRPDQSRKGRGPAPPKTACLHTPSHGHQPSPAHLQTPLPFRTQTKSSAGAQGCTSLGFCDLGGVLARLLLGARIALCVGPAQTQEGLLRVPLSLPLLTWVLPGTTSCVTCSHCPPRLSVQSRNGMLLSLLFTRMR